MALNTKVVTIVSGYMCVPVLVRVPDTIDALYCLHCTTRFAVMEYIIEEEEDTIAGYKLKVPGDNPPLQQSIRKRYKNGVDISSTSHLPAVSEKTTSERVRQMEIFMECPICAGFMVNPILTVPCGHSFCSS